MAVTITDPKPEPQNRVVVPVDPFAHRGLCARLLMLDIGVEVNLHLVMDKKHERQSWLAAWHEDRTMWDYVTIKPMYSSGIPVARISSPAATAFWEVMCRGAFHLPIQSEAAVLEEFTVETLEPGGTDLTAIPLGGPVSDVYVTMFARLQNNEIWEENSDAPA